MRETKIIMLASENHGKIHEFRELFKKYPEFEFRTLDDIVSNPRALKNSENGTNYYENAYSKGRLGHISTKVPTISDDTGLEVDALGSKPGVLSARYAETEPGYTKDESNVRKLLEELRGVAKEKRTARFVCTMVFFIEGLTFSATGTLEGSILETPRGTHGFGYDSVFLVKGTDKSLAEMTMEEKNQVSHRAVALDHLIRQIREKNLHLVKP